MRGKRPNDCLNPAWLKSLTDPVADELARSGKTPDLDYIRSLFPAVTGDPAFDHNVIKGNIERLETGDA